MPDTGANTFTIFVGLRTLNETSDVPAPPMGLRLRNAPNPFNPMTEFRFNLPRAGEAEIRIFDLRGAEAGRVRGGVMPAGPGTLRWSGQDRGRREVASGTYFTRLFLDGRQAGPTLKVTLLK